MRLWLLVVVGITLTITEAAVRSRRQSAQDFVCPKASGLFADPNTCRRFFQCVDNHPYQSRCPSGLYFDDISKLCTFKNEATCGPVDATEAPIVNESDTATECDTSKCVLPECFCSLDGTRIPNDLEPEDTPQMVIISMDDTLNALNYKSYRKLFEGRTNPNKCPIRGTFFIAHEYSDYQMIQELHYEGHEIATYSISHRKNLETLGYQDWVQEQIGMREILNNFAKISKDNILGMRAPSLKPGRNAQFEVLVDYGYDWDSSASVPPTPVPIWPYTLDHAIPHECRSGTCPTRSFPGVWEFPLNSHYTESFEGGYCPYMDQCVLHGMDPEEVFEWLKEDFSRYYDQNRAPYLMAYHTSWFQQEHLVKGLDLFMDYLQELQDVWFVTHSQALDWLTDPKTTSQMGNYQPWDCSNRVAPAKPCNLPTSCSLPFNVNNQTDVRYLSTCFKCPTVYPWLGDAKGRGRPEPDVYKSDNPSL